MTGHRFETAERDYAGKVKAGDDGVWRCAACGVRIDDPAARYICIGMKVHSPFGPRRTLPEVGK